MNQPESNPKPECACIHPDAIECVRRRDGFETDDRRYERRECSCCCHERDEDDESYPWGDMP